MTSKLASPISAGARPTTPLELLGNSTGLSVVDPGTVLTRLWYFDGKFLRASGFRLDQEYVRSLVALSNQASGTGVVSGLGVSRGTGDRLRVTGGLALAPSGRVVHLPQQVELSIAELIARSSGSFDPGSKAEAGPDGAVDFSRCPPDQPSGPDQTLAASPLYVLTASSVEALCGEEERFGRLCEDACATETDRSTVVEGVSFRVRELTLALPTSTAVAFGDRHLRSRVASAYFEQERRAVTSLISGAGLRNPIWCGAAEGIGGEEVPLAVLDRSGPVTRFIDAWIARRELMEATPSRYWAARMARRPEDVFLAQVLQFQCQLLNLGADGGGGIPDPCGDERDALASASQVLASLTAGVDGPVAPESKRASGVGVLPPDAYSRVEALRSRITAVLGAGVLPGTGSLLVDGGIVEVPSAGYLPISLAGDVHAQVRALLGPGVDLRFCAVRPDFIPEAFLEAQHMERISLTRGLDDPGDLEEADVLVPGGRIVAGGGKATAGFVGTARFQPRSRPTPDGEVEQGSAITLSVVGRDTTSTGWSWSAAGFGEAPSRLGVNDLVRGTLQDVRSTLRDAPAEESGQTTRENVRPVEVPIASDEEHDKRHSTDAFTQRLRREAAFAATRKARGSSEEADRPVGADEDRPLAAWVDGETSADLRILPVGGTTDILARGSFYSRDERSPVLQDARVTGRLRVVDVLNLGSRRIVRTLLDGVADTFHSDSPGEADTELHPIKALPVAWAFGVQTTGARLLAVAVDDPATITVSFTDVGSPRHITGELVERSRPGPVIVTPRWQPAPVTIDSGFDSSARADAEPLLTVTLDEKGDALAPAAKGRALAESVISILGTELALPGRDPAFAAYATDRLLGGLGGGGSQRIEANTDWVLFHRRRTKLCSDDVAPPPTRTLTYRLYHRVIDRRQRGDRSESATGFEDLRGRWVRGDGGNGGFVRIDVPVDRLGFEPVATLEFAADGVEMQTPASVLRTSWQAAERGSRLTIAGVGDLGEGDGEVLALGRLGTVRSAVADLIDAAGAQLEYLLEIPPEFQQPGLDGVMFTVGERPVQRTCLPIYRLSRSEHARVLDQLRQVGETAPIEAVIQGSDSTADVFSAEFVEEKLVDPESLRQQWGEFDTLFGVVGLPRATSDEEQSLWRNRALQVARAIGTDNVSDEFPPTRATECGGAFLVAAQPQNG